MMAAVTQRRRIPWRALVVTLITGTLFATSALPALAHATLVESTPADESVLPHSPGDVELRYDQPVTVSAGSVKVLAPDGTRVDTGQITTKNGQTTVVDPLPATLSAGTYTILWRVVSADTHTVFGATTFSVGAVSSTSAAAASAIQNEQSAGRAADQLLDLSRFLFYIGLLLLVGGLGFLLGLWPRGRELRSGRRLLWAGWSIALIGTVGGLLMQGPYSEGLSLYWTFDPQLIGQVLSSRFGVTSIGRLVFLVGLAVALAGLRRFPRWVTATLSGLCGLGLLLSTTAVGHAGTGDLVGFAFPADVLHLAAAAAWMGGLAVLAVVMLRKPPAELIRVLPRWSRLAELAVTVLVLTGVFAGWRQVREWGALFSTTYGWLLLAKVALVGVALAFGALGRRRVRTYWARAGAPDLSVDPPAVGGIPTQGGSGPVSPADEPWGDPAPGGGGTAVRTRPPVTQHRRILAEPALAPVGLEPASRRAARILRRGVAVEALLGLVVLGVTSFLVSTTPAEQAYFPTFSQSAAVTANLELQADVAPARVGLDALRVAFTDPAGRSVDVQALTGRWTLTAGDTVVPVTLTRTSLGHYEIQRVELPSVGSWQLALSVKTSDFDATEMLFHVRIR